ncbi:MAG TPA: CDP-alcohol phosphatidyltransferase family protein, partial [Polyangia bacterium]|nr:CDP-alcohol phosphatidyltransferase family protein [Polyangia bacterium]
MSVHVDDVHPGARRMFGVKDVFTILNALGGVVALVLCAEGRWLWASYAIMAGYAADMVDGSIARALREANRFGAEFDTAADFVTQAVAPALVVYLAYRDAAVPLGLSARAAQLLGAALAAVLIIPGCARYARRNVRPVAIDFAWIGLPQVVASFVMLGFVNSIVVRGLPGGLWAGAILVPALAALELSNRPFKNHRGRRRNFPHVRALIAGFILTSVATFVLAPRFAWDVLLFWELGYVLT